MLTNQCGHQSKVLLVLFLIQIKSYNEGMFESIHLDFPSPTIRSDRECASGLGSKICSLTLRGVCLNDLWVRFYLWGRSSDQRDSGESFIPILLLYLITLRFRVHDNALKSMTMIFLIGSSGCSPSSTCMS